MKAVQIEAWGDNSVLKMNDIPKPQPRKDEILVKIAGAGVNPVDWKVREGYYKEGKTFPLTLGWEFAGTVEEVGENVEVPSISDSVYAYESGDEIYAYEWVLQGQGIGYAEYAVVAANKIALAPKSIDLTEAGGVPLAALTAWQALFDEGKLRAGQRVLIHAGAGGVGSFAIQFAKNKGAIVVATASPKNFDILRQLGADEVLDYHQPNYLEGIEPVDLVLDTIGGDIFEASFSVVKPGGKIVSIVDPNITGKNGIDAKFVLVHPDSAQLTEIARLIDDDKIKPLISEILPLSQAAKALDKSQNGHVIGKIILKP